MSIPDSVLAAIIAGTATLSASFVQLRSALLREAAGRSTSAASRRRQRLQLIILLAVIGAAGVCGFALSQWLTAGERAAQGVMQRELQARVAEISRTASQLELTRGSERAEIESGVLRRIGSEGIVVMAMVPACRARAPLAPVSASPPVMASPLVTASPPVAASPPVPPVASPPVAGSPPPPAAAPAAGSPGASPAAKSAEAQVAAARPCTEAEASPVTLCATIPGNASVTEVALFSRAADSESPWSASRYLPGQESGAARFAPTYSENAPEAGTRQVCQAFTQWSSDHARIVRMVVRYSLPA